MEERKSNVADFLRWVHLRAEDEFYPGGTIHDNAVLVWGHVKETWKIFVTWTLLQIGVLIAYIAFASAEANFNSSSTEYTYIYRLVHFICVAALLLNILGWTFVGARVGVYSAALSLIHAIGFPIANLIYSFVSFILPDALENAFDKERKLKQALDDARDNAAVHTLASEIITSYLSSVAWLIFISWLVLIMPVKSFQNPTAVLLSLAAVIFLIYATFGWSRTPYWLEKIQTAAMYLAAGYVIIKMAIVPLLDSVWFAGLSINVDAVPVYTNLNLVQIALGLGLILIFLYLLSIIIAKFNGGGRPKMKGSYADGTTSGLLPFFVIAIIALLVYFASSAVWRVVAKWGEPPVVYTYPNRPSQSSSGNMNTNTLSVRPELVKDRAYKFSSDGQLYVYDGDKLRPFLNDRAFAVYFGCPKDCLPSSCREIYVLPSTVRLGDNVLKGGVIR